MHPSYLKDRNQKTLNLRQEAEASLEDEDSLQGRCCLHRTCRLWGQTWQGGSLVPTKLRLVWACISQATLSYLLVNSNCGKFRWILFCHLVTKQILCSPSKTVLPSIPSQTASIFNVGFSSFHHGRWKLLRHQMLNVEMTWPDQPRGGGWPFSQSFCACGLRWTHLWFEFVQRLSCQEFRIGTAFVDMCPLF